MDASNKNEEFMGRQEKKERGIGKKREKKKKRKEKGNILGLKKVKEDSALYVDGDFDQKVKSSSTNPICPNKDFTAVILDEQPCVRRILVDPSEVSSFHLTAAALSASNDNNKDVLATTLVSYLPNLKVIPQQKVKDHMAPMDSAQFVSDDAAVFLSRRKHVATVEELSQYATLEVIDATTAQEFTINIAVAHEVTVDTAIIESKYQGFTAVGVEKSDTAVAQLDGKDISAVNFVCDVGSNSISLAEHTIAAANAQEFGLAGVTRKKAVAADSSNASFEVKFAVVYGDSTIALQQRSIEGTPSVGMAATIENNQAYLAASQCNLARACASRSKSTTSDTSLLVATQECITLVETKNIAMDGVHNSRALDVSQVYSNSFIQCNTIGSQLNSRMEGGMVGSPKYIIALPFNVKVIGKVENQASKSRMMA
ncbi:hypothetical protein ACH5RR_026552 [Cinchona calisaya]|uniref:Uncharacterized protein n=1 Tax=Cinchona calisaya TaxID=153742 RepID=A0ABD2Z672_9GENT